MIICPECFTLNKNKKITCQKCGNSILGISKELNNENIWKWRRKQRLQWNLAAGVFVCIASTLVFGPHIYLGLKPFLISMLICIAFGLTLGFFISKFSRSIWSAMGVSTGIGVIFFMINILAHFENFTILHAYSCFTIGIIPSVIMGLAIGMDEYL